MNRDNIKSTWQTLNALTKKSKQSSTYPESFDDNGKCVSDKNVAVNKFNQYFVNVVVDLANKIPVPKRNTSFHYYNLCLKRMNAIWFFKSCSPGRYHNYSKQL